MRASPRRPLPGLGCAPGRAGPREAVSSPASLPPRSPGAPSSGPRCCSPPVLPGRRAHPPAAPAGARGCPLPICPRRPGPLGTATRAVLPPPPPARPRPTPTAPASRGVRTREPDSVSRACPSPSFRGAAPAQRLRPGRGRCAGCAAGAGRGADGSRCRRCGWEAPGPARRRDTHPGSRGRPAPHGWAPHLPGPARASGRRAPSAPGGRAGPWPPRHRPALSSAALTPPPPHRDVPRGEIKVLPEFGARWRGLWPTECRERAARSVACGAGRGAGASGLPEQVGTAFESAAPSREAFGSRPGVPLPAGRAPEYGWGW